MLPPAEVFSSANDWVNLQPACDPFQRPESEIALPPLELAHARAMNLEHVGERFLAQPASLPMGPQVVPDGPLKFARHIAKAAVPLLDGLQPYM